jgi:hypothetical protein
MNALGTTWRTGSGLGTTAASSTAGCSAGAFQFEWANPIVRRLENIVYAPDKEQIALFVYAHDITCLVMRCIRPASAAVTRGLISSRQAHCILTIKT